MPRPCKTVNGVRQCNVCKQHKPVTEFNRNGKWHKAYCKDCGKKELQDRRDWINTFKNKPCHDCGKQYPTVLMDFDHVPERGVKLNKIGNLTSRERIIEEIAKCDIVCPTCHRIRTATRAGLLTEEELNEFSQF